MRKFKQILESKDQIDEIREHLYPIEDFGYEVNVVIGNINPGLYLPPHSINMFSLSSDGVKYPNCYIFVISKKPKSSVTIRNEHPLT